MTKRFKVNISRNVIMAGLCAFNLTAGSLARADTTSVVASLPGQVTSAVPIPTPIAVAAPLQAQVTTTVAAGLPVQDQVSATVPIYDQLEVKPLQDATVVIPPVQEPAPEVSIEDTLEIKTPFRATECSCLGASQTWTAMLTPTICFASNLQTDEGSNEILKTPGSTSETAIPNTVEGSLADVNSTTKSVAYGAIESSATDVIDDPGSYASSIDSCSVVQEMLAEVPSDSGSDGNEVEYRVSDGEGDYTPVSFVSGFETRRPPKNELWTSKDLCTKAKDFLMATYLGTYCKICEGGKKGIKKDGKVSCVVDERGADVQYPEAQIQNLAIISALRYLRCLEIINEQNKTLEKGGQVDAHETCMMVPPVTSCDWRPVNEAIALPFITYSGAFTSCVMDGVKSIITTKGAGKLKLYSSKISWICSTFVNMGASAFCNKYHVKLSGNKGSTVPTTIDPALSPLITALCTVGN